jgi:CxxC motif-containing protein (DUF1111 family)
MRAKTWAVRSLALALLSWAGPLVLEPSANADANAPDPEVIGKGRILFQRIWRPHDILSHNGDGLGPVFNELSCVSCHNLGGSGGGGSIHRNVELVTPRPNNPPPDDAAATRHLIGSLKIQTGLRSLTSSVLHKFGTSPTYYDWRRWLVSRTGFPDFTLRRTERNTPALFGAGLIDAIPDSVIEEQARRAFPIFPDIHGRVCRLQDGRIGRFGWKGQTATLDDFVRTACAAELGLEAPGHHQSPDPSDPTDHVAELDLTEADCRALVAYVASLPAPVRVEPSQPSEARRAAAGGALFKEIGCATCHTPTLGTLDGLYSDLLLHDLGPENSGDGYYGSGIGIPPQFVNGPSGPGTGEKPRIIGALSPEWRTTPLWGLRDSPPYMHDGKAPSLEAAIKRHGGEAAPVVARFDALNGEQKIQLRRFLLSLAAPPGAEPLSVPPKRRSNLTFAPKWSPARLAGIRFDDRF